MTDIAFFPAHQLAGMIRSRQIGSLELLDHYLRRVERFNPALNAIIWMDVEGARARAAKADAALARGEQWGPLHGLPMTIKESFDLLGSPTTWGIPAMRQNISRGNAVATQRLLDAGAVIFGKTNVPLLLADWQSFNEIYGTTNNPWDVTKTPGGSSGGSSAALASGMTALELGSDIGASIRNPAHYCGVMGHKPTWGIVPPRGQTVTGAMAMADISVSGPLARTVDDLALALGTMAGPDELDAAGWRLVLPKPKKARLADYRVAVMAEDPNCAVDSEYSQRITDLGNTLAKAGATVSFDARPAVDLRAAHRLYIRLLRGVTMARIAPEAFAEWQRKAAALSPDDRSYKAEVARAAMLMHRDWLVGHEERTKMRWAWHAFFKEWDVLLTPVAAGPAWPHDQKGERLDRKIIVNGKAEDTNDQLFWAGISGMVLLPSTVTPLGLNKAGLPLGVQIIGDHLQDLTTIEMARLVVDQIGGFVPPRGIEAMFQRIMIACDSRPESEGALREGVKLAGLLKAELVLFGICIADPAILIAEANAPSDLPARMAEEFRDDLEKEAVELRQQGFSVQVHCTDSDEGETICAAARETKADLLVIAHRHKTALQKLVDPARDYSILDHMRCHLLVIGDHA